MSRAPVTRCLPFSACGTDHPQLANVLLFLDAQLKELSALKSVDDKEPAVAAVKCLSKFKAELEQRLYITEPGPTPTIWAIAAYLHPVYKRMRFYSHSESMRKKVMQWLQAEIDDMDRPMEDIEPNGEQKESKDGKDVKDSEADGKSSVMFQRIFGSNKRKFVDAAPENANKRAHVDNPLVQLLVPSADPFAGTTADDLKDQQTELERYEAMAPCSGNDFDLGQKWLELRSHYPKLYRLAKRVHAVQATSAASERSFSGSGFIVSDRRCKLASETTKELMTLRQNRHLLPEYANCGGIDVSEVVADADGYL